MVITLATRIGAPVDRSTWGQDNAAPDTTALKIDAQSFFSAVVSGAVHAAGSYIVTLFEDAGMRDLVIKLGQDVRISGDPSLAVAPSWDNGGFSVQQDEKLVLEGVVLTPNAPFIIHLRFFLCFLFLPAAFPENTFQLGAWETTRVQRSSWFPCAFMPRHTATVRDAAFERLCRHRFLAAVILPVATIRCVVGPGNRVIVIMICIRSVCTSKARVHDGDGCPRVYSHTLSPAIVFGLNCDLGSDHGQHRTGGGVERASFPLCCV
jgi:hypothetical protein